MSTKGALVRDSDEEYTLRTKNHFDRVWITVDGFSVQIRKTDEGVVVDIWQLGREAGDSIASTYAFDNELDDEEEV